MQMSFRDALVRAQRDAMNEDDRVFVYGLDVGDHKSIFGSTATLVKDFGSKRCFSTPLSEDALTGIGIGAAIAGLRPIQVHIRVDFLLLGVNQLVNMASALRILSGGSLSLPLVVRAVIGRGWGQGAQHSKTMHNIFAHVPGLKVVMPTTPQDAYSLLRASIKDNNPVIFLEHRWLYDIEDQVDLALDDQLGTAKVIREGSDLTVVTTSWMAIEALHAAKILKERHNVNIEVVDVRSISPLDEQTILKSVNKTKRCIVADYDWVFCGFSGEVSTIIYERLFNKLLSPISRLGFAHTQSPTTRCLENEFYPYSRQIIEEVERMLKLTPTNLEGVDFYSYENKFKGPF